MDQSNVTVLRQADGTAQHAILPWQEYQALLRAAEGHGLQPPIPAEVRQAIADGRPPGAGAGGSSAASTRGSWRR